MSGLGPSKAGAKRLRAWIMRDVDEVFFLKEHLEEFTITEDLYGEVFYLRKWCPFYTNSGPFAAEPKQYPLHIWVHVQGISQVYSNTIHPGEMRPILRNDRFRHNTVVGWSSRRQTVVALSTMVAEFYALCEITRDILWLREHLKYLGLESRVKQKKYHVSTDSRQLVNDRYP